MYIRLLRSALAAFSLLVSSALFAQTQCDYILEIYDTAGDGWGDNFVTISTNNTSVNYALDGANDDGIDSTIYFPVQEGATWSLSFTQNNFWWQCGIRVYNNAGELLYEVSFPGAGTLYTGVAHCILCADPKAFAVDNIWDTRVRLRWNANNNGVWPSTSWEVFYGLQGFDLAAGEGDTVSSTQTKVTITGLEKKTWYDAYLLQHCDTAGGVANLVGPISFQTYWTNDIGIAGVAAPESGCGLSFDSVKVILKNYGSAPQSLFTYRYDVNGTPAGVTPPADGFYTGILGKDSSVVIAFEKLSDFSEPGEYRLDIYTELATDEDVVNDTFTYYFTNSLHLPYSQQFEVWDGAWKPSGTNSSWAFGTPDKLSIPNAASGENAWVTSLSGPYNALEYAYLESPCFDFSDQTVDPVITFSQIRDLEPSYDGSWLELSVDNGQNWEKVGASDEGVNWYNEDNVNLNLDEVWSGGSDGWETARHRLNGAAGHNEVKVRFAMASDGFVQLGGYGIDDVRILKPFQKDLAGLTVSTLGEAEECGLENDQIAFTFNNYGSQPQTGIKIAYSINGGAPVINNVPGTLAPDKSISFSFGDTFDSRDALTEIKCWTILNGDEDTANDTAVYTVSHLPRPLPFHENFEALIAPPADWTYDPEFGFSVTNAHNNVSNVLAFNLYSGNTEFTADLPRHGVVNMEDSLRFTYRVTNYATQGQTATALLLGNKIEVQVSTNCGETYQTLLTITSLNHTPTILMRERKISLKQFAGQSIKVRFHGVWNNGDFWVDIDNINILSCASDMGLQAAVTPATPGQSDGSATVSVGLGNPPYSFEWSNGSTGATADSLAAGAYVVTVTDAFGCTASLNVNLGNSAVNEAPGFAKVTLSPNPTAGDANLNIAFVRATDANIELLSPLGQRIGQIQSKGNTDISETLHLQHFPAGIYLVRITAADHTMTVKLLKQ